MPNNKNKINKLKAKLEAGGLSQSQAEAIRMQIKDLGGKVKLTNFGYNAPAGAGTQNVANLTNAANPIKDPGSVYSADVAGEQAESSEQIKFQNPNFTNPFGSQTTTQNPDGTVSVNQQLSPEQQAILAQGQLLTQQGQGLAQQGLGGYQQFNFGDFGEERGRIEGEVYNRLTKGLDDDYNRSRSSKEQELFNKGIPYSDDPNSRYQKELGDLDRRYDEAKLQARSQATIQGGQEMQSQYGMQLGQHQQGLSDLYSLQGLGTGLQLPQFQQYQGPNYDVSDPSQYIYAGKELQQGNKQLNLQQQQLQQQAAIANKQLAAANAQNAPAPPAFP